MSLNGDLEVVQKLVDAALASLEANRARIDDLNVYPVPDGDTGTNLTMTVRAVVEAVDATSAASRQSLARDVARGALMGARGNSGVIFSQIVRGAADVLGETDDAAIDADATARALRGATDAAYRAVRRPVEGTMLSVIRELAEEAEAQRADSARRSPSCSSSSCGAARKRSRARPSSCRCCATRASSTRAAPACSSSCAASPRP